MCELNECLSVQFNMLGCVSAGECVCVFGGGGGVHETHGNPGMSKNIINFQSLLWIGFQQTFDEIFGFE